jgi:predicted amidophosphoribosyltransferase
MTNDQQLCPDCGEPATDFREGICVDCFNERTSDAGLFISEYDEWNALTPAQRDQRIQEALR